MDEYHVDLEDAYYSLFYCQVSKNTVNYPIHIDAIVLKLSIANLKGLIVKISIK